MSDVNIDKLAELARLEIPESEKESIRKDFGAILNYIKQIEEVDMPLESVQSYDMTNVFRPDVVTQEKGTYSESIKNEMPDQEQGFLKVKQIM